MLCIYYPSSRITRDASPSGEKVFGGVGNRTPFSSLHGKCSNHWATDRASWNECKTLTERTIFAFGYTLGCSPHNPLPFICQVLGLLISLLTRILEFQINNFIIYLKYSIFSPYNLIQKHNIKPYLVSYYSCNLTSNLHISTVMKIFYLCWKLKELSKLLLTLFSTVVLLFLVFTP